MNALGLLTEKIAYNRWANQLVVEWLHQQPADLYEKEVASSFPTINKLLHHIMEAEKYYFSLLRQEEETYDLTMETHKVFEELVRIDQELLEWVLSQEADEMGKEISLQRSPVMETYTVATLLTHLVNHSTYHRGQLIALRHQLEMTQAPKVDYYRYFIAQLKGSTS